MIDRLQQVVDELDYDFAQWTLPGFVEWLGERFGREIVLAPGDMKLLGRIQLDGFWISNASAPKEHIFYSDRLSTYQMTHTVLHEIGHLLCHHETVRLDNPYIEVLTAALAGETPIDATIYATATARVGNVRAIVGSRQEVEAEMVASLLMQKALDPDSDRGSFFSA